MQTDLVSKRYVKALFNTCSTTDVTAVFKELLNVITAIENKPTLSKCIKDPTVQNKTKKEFIEKITESVSFSDKIKHFLFYVIDKHRIINKEQ